MIEVGFLLLGAALLLLVLFSLPIFWKIWRAVSDLAITLDALNKHLPGILKNMEEISTNINNSTTTMNNEINKYSTTANRLHKVMDNLVSGVEIVLPFASRLPLIQKVTQLAAVTKGVSVFLKVLFGKERK